MVFSTTEHPENSQHNWKLLVFSISESLEGTHSSPVLKQRNIISLSHFKLWLPSKSKNSSKSLCGFVVLWYCKSAHIHTSSFWENHPVVTLCHVRCCTNCREKRHCPMDSGDVQRKRMWNNTLKILRIIRYRILECCFHVYFWFKAWWFLSYSAFYIKLCSYSLIICKTFSVLCFLFKHCQSVNICDKCRNPNHNNRLPLPK